MRSDFSLKNKKYLHSTTVPQKVVASVLRALNFQSYHGPLQGGSAGPHRQTIPGCRVGVGTTTVHTL